MSGRESTCPSINPSIEGQNGHGALFAAARHLRTGFALGNEEAFPLLQEFNARARLPWPEAEL
ncbi:hypothetical protein [Limnoglobus roseus]|uniref:hypothetical protein n=1 Tax=Limnoglobus roseus TaxID=2598579 RepID=UPI001FE614CA|nr:hypothetical protein [Limnoglobus roseus]